MTQRISLDPDPPVQGQPVEICYDFSGLELNSTRLKVTFKPQTEAPTEHTVTPGDNCVTVQVPAGAESILVEDLDGPSPDKGAIVEGS